MVYHRTSTRHGVSYEKDNNADVVFCGSYSHNGDDNGLRAGERGRQLAD
ncbi:hypothetical protein SAMN05443144_106148 [Fodinibius roseus]|uniref:Uncharacterized protein n=1 Tax=Fodinibius roseus TaxID=1194090 RepID=A0A1M4ZVE0_9BACT|nr:hypothetical protein SAMN05443144_106148 [Fodinibius roseus]